MIVNFTERVIRVVSGPLSTEHKLKKLDAITKSLEILHKALVVNALDVYAVETQIAPYRIKFKA